MPIQHITELFALDGPKFIREAYCNLLQHDPDTQGMAYYLGRLAQGHSKESIIFQLARSSECRPHQEILGLEALVKAERRAQHWFWGRADRIKRMKNKIHKLQMALAEHKNSYNKLEGGLTAAHIQEAYRLVLGRDAESEALINGPAGYGTIENLYQALLSSEEFQKRLNNEFHGLTAAHIQEAYRLVLGREAESEALINGPAGHGTIENLYRNLFSSEEYRQRFANSQNQFDGLTKPLSEILDDYAMQIYKDIELEIKLYDKEVA
ncbi:DUF4214 domain-containing protein [Acidithiobacillus sp. M4-SHS-6]|uniref:DUF4214 domain-containing protein n=1 Tax=Acidithiobacillus sp. M4-SHS-6 TaxID=3383024 RepID=UPI0039BDF777